MAQIRKVICVVGMPGAGKSIVSKALAEALNTQVISMGDVVRYEASRRGIGKDLISMMKFAEELRRMYGKDAVAKLTVLYIRKLNIGKEVLIIDGVRSLSEVEVFRRNFNDVAIVAIHSSPKTRFRRLKERGRPDDPKTWDEFRLRDEKELKFGIGNVIALADYMVVNEDKEISELIREVKDIAHRLVGNNDRN